MLKCTDAGSQSREMADAGAQAVPPGYVTRRPLGEPAGLVVTLQRAVPRMLAELAVRPPPPRAVSTSLGHDQVGISLIFHLKYHCWGKKRWPEVRFIQLN